jgi:hypothetical protein
MKIVSLAFFNPCLLDRKLHEPRLCLDMLKKTNIATPAGKRTKIFLRDCRLLGCVAV